MRPDLYLTEWLRSFKFPFYVRGHLVFLTSPGYSEPGEIEVVLRVYFYHYSLEAAKEKLKKFGLEPLAVCRVRYNHGWLEFKDFKVKKFHKIKTSFLKSTWVCYLSPTLDINSEYAEII